MAPSDLHFRAATPADCGVILRHRRRMFEDMKEGSAQDLDRMVEATAPWIEHALGDGSYRGWLAETGAGAVVAGAGVLVSSWPAGPRDPRTRRAVILNVYCEPEFRRQGIAHQMMVLILKWLRARDFSSVALHASAEGRHLYETMGFQPTNEMRLNLS